MNNVHPCRPVLRTIAFPVALLSLMWFNVGCASIISGGKDTINLSSSIPRSKVQVLDHKGREIAHAETTNTVIVNRGKGFFVGAHYVFKVTDPSGKQTREYKVGSGMNPWYIGNLGFGGLIGFLIVDPITGAMFDFPENLYFDFDKPPGSKPGTSLPKPPKQTKAVASSGRSAGAASSAVAQR